MRSSHLIILYYRKLSSTTSRQWRSKNAHLPIPEVETPGVRPGFISISRPSSVASRPLRATHPKRRGPAHRCLSCRAFSAAGPGGSGGVRVEMRSCLSQTALIHAANLNSYRRHRRQSRTPAALSSGACQARRLSLPVGELPGTCVFGGRETAQGHRLFIFIQL